MSVFGPDRSPREEDFKALRETSEALSALKRLHRGGWQTIAMHDVIQELEERISDIGSRVTTNA